MARPGTASGRVMISSMVRGQPSAPHVQCIGSRHTDRGASPPRVASAMMKERPIVPCIKLPDLEDPLQRQAGAPPAEIIDGDAGHRRQHRRHDQKPPRPEA